MGCRNATARVLERRCVHDMRAYVCALKVAMVPKQQYRKKKISRKLVNPNQSILLWAAADHAFSRMLRHDTACNESCTTRHVRT